MKPIHPFQLGLSFIVLLAFTACSGDAVQGPGERSIGDSGVADTGPAVNNGLECEVDDDCEDAERCKHFGEISLCVLGCGSDDDCPSTQPTCELYEVAMDAFVNVAPMACVERGRSVKVETRVLVFAYLPHRTTASGLEAMVGLVAATRR